MKSLVVYYSRTGNTRKAADSIARLLKSDIEEITDTKNRDGVIGYLKSGRDAMLKKTTVIKQIRKNHSGYDLVIIGTPVWAWNVSTPVRTYLMEHKKEIGKVKRIAFFCTEGGSGGKKAFMEMEKECNKKPAAVLELLEREVRKGSHITKVEGFARELKSCA